MQLQPSQSRSAHPVRIGCRGLCRLGALLALSILVGCTTTYPVNPPLAQATDQGYRFSVIEQANDRNDQVLFLLAFSGGGTRAAAFSYGVLQELANTEKEKNGHKVRLSDEIDVITAVSGGSFTAAYFGLYQDRIFEDFESRFLRRDVQGELTSRVVFNPANWFRLLSPYYSRADLATELYDETIFDQATYADLGKSGGPFIVVNATDMSLGSRFEFDQPYFNLICSDLDGLPVARAVTASSAVPVLFSPVTLVNRAGTCGTQEPEWITKALRSKQRTSRLYNIATNMKAIENREERPYLHLFDGGLADNLGLRTLLDSVMRHESFAAALQGAGIPDTRSVVVILVNAETALDVESAHRSETPSFSATINAATSVPLARYSFETVALMKDRLEEWKRQSYAERCGIDITAEKQAQKGEHDSECHGIDTYFIEVNFSEHPDPKERDYLKFLPTSFRLTDEAVDRLIKAGRTILRRNSEYQELIQKK